MYFSIEVIKILVIKYDNLKIILQLQQALQLMHSL